MIIISDSEKKIPIISEEIINQISDILFRDISIFKKINPGIDYINIDWDDDQMKQVLGVSLETWEYGFLQSHKIEQLYIRSLLKFYNCVYRIHLGNGKGLKFVTNINANRIFEVFKTKYYNNFMEIIYNKYKHENVNYFSTSLYKEALEVITTTFINDKLKYYTEINLAEIIHDWLNLNIKGNHYDFSTNRMIKVKTCKDLFLQTCTNHSDKRKAYINLDKLVESWKGFIHEDNLDPLSALITKVFFIAVFNAVLDRMDYEKSETSSKVKSMEKNFLATHGCAIREHAQKSILAFIEDAKNYKRQHDHEVIKVLPEDDDYSLFDCFIAPIISEKDGSKYFEIIDRYTDPMQSESRIAKLMAPYQVMYSKMTTMESQMLFALNIIYNTKNIANTLDNRKEPLLTDKLLLKSNKFYKDECFVKEKIEDYQELIKDITKDYALLYDHASWSFIDEINKILKKFHEDNPDATNQAITMINLYNALKILIGSFEEFIYLNVRNPIDHIYKEFFKCPYKMNFNNSDIFNYEYSPRIIPDVFTFKNYLDDSYKESFIDFLNNSCKIIDGDKTWSCYETVLIPIINILSEHGKKLITQIDKINEGFVKFEKFVCEWYIVMMNRSKYVIEFNINEYKKFINESRISILQDRISEFL